ncbi:ATP-binding protein [Longivirga aurantiaca]|uniref:ATP-binding protein n=1 Tax=Longivirga aurantiaca TaxID=1837743 RepID=A0ABW1T4D4_9ACTN
MTSTVIAGTRWVCLPASMDSPSRSRAFVREALVGWALRDLIDDAVLLVSELASNAVLHARTTMVVGACWTPSTRVLRVCVLDDDTDEPVQRHADPTATSGRGLEIVNRIASRWGVIQGADGKSVWFELVPAA